jgi:MFS family permease
MAPPIPAKLRWRLSMLWALQWAITGSLLTYLPLYFTEHQVDSAGLGQLMAVASLGLLGAPLVVGQICDRWMNSERYLALAHFVGGVTLLYIPEVAERYSETQDNFSVLLLLTGVYAIAYFPTIPLATSLSFRHLPDPDTQFGRVRIWGTVGWVLAGVGLSVWLGQIEVQNWLYRTFNGQVVLREQKSVFEWLGSPSSDDAFDIAAVLSFALAAFCVFLPRTPPLRVRKGKQSALAVVGVIKQFWDPQFALLIALSFVLALVVPFYSYAVPMLLEYLGISGHWVPAAMTVGQISEFPCLALLHRCFVRWGAKVTFAVGMAAWLLRYGLFAVDLGSASLGMVLLGVSLHGVCHVFLVVVIQLYIDRRCPPDSRATAQNLFAFLTMGIAMPLGFLVAGRLGQWCRLTAPDQADYSTFFAVPAVTVGVLLVVFWKFARLKLPAEDLTAATEPKELNHGGTENVE